MAEFSTPPSVKAAPKDFPKPVPFEQLDEARREEYADLQEAKIPVENKPEPVSETKPVDPIGKPVMEEIISLKREGIVLRFVNGLLDKVEKDPGYVSEVTDAEKQEFIRSIIGGKAYVKTYQLFGGIEAVFSDRTVEYTEAMYAEINKLGREKSIDISNENEAMLWVQRFQMAATLKAVKQPDGTMLLDHAAVKFDTPFATLFKAVSALPRPLYQALFDAAVDFERHVELLVSKAREPDFWKAGGTS